jgi:uncharacterized protein (TIGR01319 family)
MIPAMSTRPPENLRRFCITDVGSTTTKAILFSRAAGSDGAAGAPDGGTTGGAGTTGAARSAGSPRWTCIRRETPTTVEAPNADVMIGVTRAFRELEAATGEKLLAQANPKDSSDPKDPDDPNDPQNPKHPISKLTPTLPYFSTSSAGGGLAMVVTGLVREITSRSAERVALGAGAILLDVIAMDDRRTAYEKVEALKSLRPDMVLLAGGFDGDATTGPVFLAELIHEAGLRPKLSPAAPFPIIYAGNANAADYVRDTLGEGFLFHSVPNIRPNATRENLEPAREAIHDLFMTNVMSQAPGYEELLKWVSGPILPTPGAVGKILAAASRRLGGRILAIDIGGATTDVFSAQDGRVMRTVSANLGMSYSILNVVRAAGIEGIEEALGGDSDGLSRERMWDLIGQKHLQPTRLPQTAMEVKVERAVAIVAIREAVRDHLRFLAGFRLSRGKEELSIRDRFFGGGGRDRETVATGPLRLAGYDLVIGSGGILSHSDREAAVTILAKALRPAGEVDVAIDSEFMLPHLGVLAETLGGHEGIATTPDLATDLLLEIGLVRMGKLRSMGFPETVVLPRGTVEQEVMHRVHRGPLRARRELAIPGEVLVSMGDVVDLDRLIARSTRTFRRPFFYDLAAALKVPPGEVERHLLAKVGDEIRAGDIIAERKVNLLSEKSFHAPYGGRIERLLPNGVLIVRERPEEAADVTTVNVAEALRVGQDTIRPYLRVEVGQAIDRGQWLASVTGRVPPRFCPSPHRGTVKEIDTLRGLMFISPLREELEVKAWMPGRVIEVTERGCVLENEGVEITAIWGTGGEVSGPLVLDDPVAGCILVRGFVTREDLSAIAESGGAGLICSGLHLQDVVDSPPPFTIVAIGCFGSTAPLPSEIASILHAHTGALTMLDGRTELRVGVRRPRVLLPRC